MKRSVLYASACLGLLSLQTVGATFYSFELLGTESRAEWEQTFKSVSPGSSISIQLHQPTGWKIDSVYDAKGVSDSDVRNNLSTPEFFEWAITKGDLVRTTDYQVNNGILTRAYQSPYIALAIRYEPYLYDVVFNANGGTGSMKSMTDQIYTNTVDTLTANEFTRIGYGFAGWTTNETGVGTVFVNRAPLGGEKFGVTKDKQTVNLYAKWTANTYNVTYEMNGGEAGAWRPASATYDTAFQVSAPTRKGYDFTGWTVSGHDASTARFGASKTSCNEPIKDGTIATEDDVWLRNLTPNAGATVTLTAQWTARNITHTINVEANGDGGTVSSNSFVVALGQPYDARGPLPTATWANDKKLFTGWYTAATGGTRIEASDSVPEDNPPSTLYAHWTNAAYVVRFDGNGVTNGTSMADQTLYFYTEGELASNAFARTGYTFAGWAQTNAPTKVAYGDGATVTDLASRAGETNVLLAVWTTNTYYVAFDPNGGSGTMQPLTNRYDHAFTLPANRFTRSGFWTFDGWLDVATGRTYKDGAEVMNLTNAPFATVSLQAKWKTSLSSLSQAMHCDNLNWEADKPSLGNTWESVSETGIGYKSDSCARQSDDLFSNQRYLATKPGAAGTLSFWLKTMGDESKLAYKISDARDNFDLKGVVYVTPVEKDRWTNVVIRIEKDDAAKYVLLINAAGGKSGGYCLIDGMTWTPDGTHPVPGADDAVEVSSMTMVNGTLSLSFTGDAQFSYRLLATDSLSPADWSDFGVTNVGRGAAQAFDIPIEATHPQRFFKIETIQTPGD